MIRRLLIVLALLVGAAAASAQVLGPPLEAEDAGPDAAAEGDLDAGGLMNPIEMVESAARVLPGGGGSQGLSGPLNVMILLTVISLVPSIMLMTTCFVRIIIVLGLLRQALGTQSLPPPQVITGLALFMTVLVMSPTMERIYDEAIVPYQAGEVADHDELWSRARQPIRDFMFDQIEATGGWSSLYMVLEYRGIDASDPSRLTRADVDMVTLIPAYMLSELKAAFLMGFRIYLPFLVIDMVIAALLISMSMMMLPPVLISLPFKILLFVMVDGWQLVVGGLLNSFRRGGEVAVASGMPWFA